MGRPGAIAFGAEDDPQVGESHETLLRGRFRGSAPRGRSAGAMLSRPPLARSRYVQLTCTRCRSLRPGQHPNRTVGKNPCLHLENSFQSVPTFFPTDLPTQAGRRGRRPRWPGRPKIRFPAAPGTAGAEGKHRARRRG